MAQGYRAAWKHNKCRHELGKRLPNRHGWMPHTKFSKKISHKLERLENNKFDIDLEEDFDLFESVRELPFIDTSEHYPW